MAHLGPEEAQQLLNALLDGASENVELQANLLKQELEKPRPGGFPLKVVLENMAQSALDKGHHAILKVFRATYPKEYAAWKRSLEYSQREKLFKKIRSDLAEDHQLRIDISKLVNSPDPDKNQKIFIQNILSEIPAITTCGWLTLLAKSTPREKWDKLVDIFNVSSKNNKPKYFFEKFLEKSQFVPNLQDKVLEIFFQNSDINELYDLLVSSGKKHLKSYGKKYLDLVENVLNSFDKKERQRIVNQLLKVSIQRSNAIFPQMLKIKFPINFNLAYDSLNPAEMEKLDKMISFKDASFLTESILEFTGDFGEIDEEGGLLTIAQINQRKKYDFHPTLVEYEKFEDYLNLLKTSPRPVNEKFVLTGIHWICGQITIDEKGKVNVLIIDSMGKTLDKQSGKSEYYATTVKPLAQLSTTFADQPLNIYFDPIKRQKSAKGCSVFALDDVRHLYTAERYLPPEFAKSGIFGFLASKSYEKENVNIEETYPPSKFSVHLTHLPLSLVRTMQTRALKTDVISRRLPKEQAMPVNKRGQTALESVDAEFVQGKNLRLKRKLAKIADANFDYLMKTSPEDVEKQTREFTLEALERRLKLKDKKEEHAAEQMLPEPQMSSPLLASFKSLALSDSPSLPPSSSSSDPAHSPQESVAPSSRDDQGSGVSSNREDQGSGVASTIRRPPKQ